MSKMLTKHWQNSGNANAFTIHEEPHRLKTQENSDGKGFQQKQVAQGLQGILFFFNVLRMIQEQCWVVAGGRESELDCAQ